MAQDESKLRFILEGAKQAGINQQSSVGERRSVDFRIFHHEEAEFDGAACALGAFRNQGVAKMRNVLLNCALGQEFHTALKFLSFPKFQHVNSCLLVLGANNFEI